MRFLVLFFVLVPMVANAQYERVTPRVDRPMPNVTPGPIVRDVDPRTGKQNFIPPVPRLPQAHTWTDVPSLTNEPILLPNIEPHRGPPSARVLDGVRRCNAAITGFRRERARIERLIEVNRLNYGGVLTSSQAEVIRNRIDMEPIPLMAEARYAQNAGMYDQCVSLANAARQTIGNIVDYALGEYRR